MTKLATPLNKAQLDILKLFNRPMSDKDLADLNDVLIDFLMKKLTESADRSIEERGLSVEEVDNWRFEHNRTATIEA